MDSVAGTVAVLTGAGSGIGRATAHSLARRGATAIVSDVDAERAQLVASESKRSEVAPKECGAMCRAPRT